MWLVCPAPLWNHRTSILDGYYMKYRSRSKVSISHHYYRVPRFHHLFFPLIIICRHPYRRSDDDDGAWPISLSCITCLVARSFNSFRHGVNYTHEIIYIRRRGRRAIATLVGCSVTYAHNGWEEIRPRARRSVQLLYRAHCRSSSTKNFPSSSVASRSNSISWWRFRFSIRWLAVSIRPVPLCVSLYYHLYCSIL